MPNFIWIPTGWTVVHSLGGGDGEALARICRSDDLACVGQYTRLAQHNPQQLMWELATSYMDSEELARVEAGQRGSLPEVDLHVPPRWSGEFHFQPVDHDGSSPHLWWSGEDLQSRFKGFIYAHGSVMVAVVGPMLDGGPLTRAPF